MRALLAVLMLAALGAAAHAQPPANVVTNCRHAQGPAGETLVDVVPRVGHPGSRPLVFACPPGTVIQMDPGTAIEIRGHVVIDGENKITIDAPAQRPSIFTVPGGRGASLTLRNITIRGAQLAPFTAASVVFTHEPLVLDNVAVEGSDFPIRALGDLTVRNSRFSGNTGTVLLVGDASREGGTAVIENSHFIGNAGWAIIGGRHTTVTGSRFVGNGSGVSLKGGAITGSLFQANNPGVATAGHTDTELSGNTFETNGTGIVMWLARTGAASRVRIARNLFSGHTLGALAITEFGNVPVPPPPGSRVAFDVAHNRFLRNSTEQSGGAILVSLLGMAPHVSMEARGNVFHDNSARETGGAISWGGGPLAISHSLFRGNRAAAGGALYARPAAGAVPSIVNSLVVESTGGAIDVPAATILNTTIARNRGHGVVFAGGAGVIANTILDQNSGGNCAGVAAPAVRPGNIQFGFADCPGVPVVNPGLDRLYVPSPGSPAAGAGDRAVCHAAPVDGVDFLFQRRALKRCSSGAYERPPLQLVNEAQRLHACPDGTRVRPGRPCPARLKVCTGGQSVPADAACPCQPYGGACGLAEECCNSVPCISGRCRFP
jgi:hypothetical protein